MALFPEQFEAAKITFAKKSPEELEALTIKETNENFVKATRELWQDFAVHGTFKKNKDTGETEIGEFTDLDGKTAIGLLKLSGVKVKGLQYLKPGDFSAGAINIDTGNRSGVVFNEADETAFFDHHGSEKDSAGEEKPSATDLVYKTMLKFGMLKKQKYLDDFVQFVNYEDNKNFPDQEKYFRQSDHNLLGLYRFMSFENMLKFFRDGRTPTEELSREDMFKYGLIYRQKNGGKMIDRSLDQKRIIDESLKALNEMEKTGLIAESEKYGRIALDLGNKVPGGVAAAAYFGCPVYLKWNDNGFFISSQRPFDEDFALSEGQKIRGTMFVRPASKEPLQIKLEEVLQQLGVDLPAQAV